AIEGWSAGLVWGPMLRLQAELVPLSAVVATTIPAVALPITLYAAVHEDQRGITRLIALLLAFVGAMELLVIAADLLTLLIGWELVGACSWALIGHHWREAKKPAAGRYAFVMTRLGDLGLFVAAMAAFAGTGSFTYTALAELDGPLLELLTAGILISAAAKSGQVPFAPWLFRAMEGPTSVSALLHAAAMVAAGAFLLARLHPVLGPVPWFGPAAMGIGLVTALGGGVVATLQADAKKLLAASTSAQFGLMFIAVGAGYPAVAVLHLVMHAAYKALLFLAAGIAGERTGSFELAEMRYGRALPGIAAVTAVGSLALAGVPPLGGAASKEAVIAAAGHSGPAVAVMVAIVGALSAVYATRFQLLTYGRGEREAARSPVRLETAALAALAAASLLLSAVWVPAVHSVAAAWLGELSASKVWELVVSLLAVGVGIYAGRLLVLTYPALGSTGSAAALADWLGLPAAVHMLIGRPARAMARAAAVLDDRALDALPRSAAVMGRHLAALGGRFGELLADGLPLGLAQIVGLGGNDVRRMQTGMTQHYYAAMAVGTAVLTFILLWGAWA
ncbi:MAG: proton-conducting transporter membrane subunit, partial [Halofilum sp. (in: g-proteobacteria)]